MLTEHDRYLFKYRVELLREDVEAKHALPTDRAFIAVAEHLEVCERALRIIAGLEEYRGRNLDSVEALQLVARAALAK